MGVGELVVLVQACRVFLTMTERILYCVVFHCLCLHFCRQCSYSISQLCVYFVREGQPNFSCSHDQHPQHHHVIAHANHPGKTPRSPHRQRLAEISSA